MTLYILYSTKDFKIRYVGITSKSLKERLYYHIRDCKKLKTHKEKWINNQIINGFDIKIRKIKIFNNISDLKKAEIILIKYLITNNYNLVNGTAGGDGTLDLTIDARNKIAEAMHNRTIRLETRLKMSISKKGKQGNAKNAIWSDKSREKAFKSKLGKPSNQRVAILQFDLNNIFVKRWNSITEAANFYNIAVSGITNHINGRTKHCNKYIWKREN